MAHQCHRSLLKRTQLTVAPGDVIVVAHLYVDTDVRNLRTQTTDINSKPLLTTSLLKPTYKTMS